MIKTTCTKLFSDFPFAHRQHSHDGHCAWIHGHNWSFEITFEADKLDDNQFVVDFGKLKWLKRWLDERFDHTLLLNENDPWLIYLQNVLQDTPESWEQGPCFSKIIVVPNCGAEGLALWIMQQVNQLLDTMPDEIYPDVLNLRNVRIVKVTVYEDSKNSATVEKNDDVELYTNSAEFAKKLDDSAKQSIANAISRGWKGGVT